MASKINADEFVDREGEGKPTLPKGVVLSGVTTITTAVVAENEVANSTGINVGIITSTHFAGNLTGDVNAGIVTVTSQTVIGSAVTISSQGIDIGAGVITATSYAGSGANLTGVGATIMVWEYNPDPYLTGLPLDTGIGITFNQKIKAGSGNITLSIANAGVAGTVVENFGIGNSVTISGNSLSFTPTSNLTATRDYCITLPSGVITNMAGDNYVGTAYTFQGRAYSNQIWSAGNNAFGGLGQNSVVLKSSPVQVPGTTWVSGEGTSDATYSIKSDGTLWVWGRNDKGQLAQNNRTERSSPVQIPGTTWSRVRYAGSAGNVVATKTDGTLWAWGKNTMGNLGQNNNVDYSSPTQIPGTTWHTEKFDAGHNKTFATKTDGTLWSWGYNTWGNLAQNNTTHRSSPVQIPGTTWSNVQDAYFHSFATKTDGTLWAWGYQNSGELGINSNTRYSSPVQVPGTTWDKIGSCLYASSATKTDGTIWTWGRNGDGVLGQNDRTNRSSPTQVPGTTWSDVQFNDLRCAFGVKTDGTLWSWGINQYGQLAQNDRTYRSSPTQIPGTDWNWIGAGGISGVLMGKRV